MNSSAIEGWRGEFVSAFGGISQKSREAFASLAMALRHLVVALELDVAHGRQPDA
jgi:hypothetical protein